MENYSVVSFSGGKDSTAMLLRLIELHEFPDEVIFCDTGLDFPEIMETVAEVKKICAIVNIKFTTLKAEKPWEYWLLEHKRTKGKWQDQKGNSFPSKQIRWCTKELKIRPINRYYKEKKEQFNIIQLVGIAADETKRAANKHNNEKNIRLPLVEWGWTEEKCLNYCKSKGLDFGGFYDTHTRAGCWCCPLQNLHDLKILWQNYPDLWAKLQYWEDRTWNVFRYGAKNPTVKSLTERFEWEERQQKLF